MATGVYLCQGNCCGLNYRRFCLNCPDSVHGPGICDNFSVCDPIACAKFDYFELNDAEYHVEQEMCRLLPCIPVNQALQARRKEAGNEFPVGSYVGDVGCCTCNGLLWVYLCCGIPSCFCCHHTASEARRQQLISIIGLCDLSAAA